MKDLRAQIESLQQTLNALKSQPGQLQKIFSMFDAAGALGTSLGDFHDSVDTYDGSLSKLQYMGAKGGKIVPAFNKFKEFFNSDDGTSAIRGTQAALDELNNKLHTLEISLQNFMAEMASKRQLALSHEISALVDVIKARTRYTSRLNARFASIDDVVRSIILTHITDTNRDPQLLDSNMRGVISYVNDYPEREPRLSLGSAEQRCMSKLDIMHCVLVIRNLRRKTVVVYPLKAANGKMIKVPLYVLSAGKGASLLDTFGIDKRELIIRTEH